MIKRILALFAAAGIVMLTACNTMEGLGKDLKQLGGNIEKKADENK